MKKIILSLLVLATFALAMPMLFAAEGEEGTVVVTSRHGIAIARICMHGHGVQQRKVQRIQTS